MKVIDLLNKIANGEIEDETIFKVNGDFFYYLIVNDENLYVINTMTNQLEKLDSKYIGRFIKYQYDLTELKYMPNKLNDEVEIIEDELRDIEVCGSLFTRSEYNRLAGIEEDKKIEKIEVNHLQTIKKWKRAKILGNKINEIIDYLNRGEK